MTANKPVYAVIDLGTSASVGMVGSRSESGRISILAYVIEPSGNCIRNGYPHNIDETAALVTRITDKLNAKLEDKRIAKVYFGFGGQSLSSHEQILRRSYGAEGHIIAREDLEELRCEAAAIREEGREVLCVKDATYYVNGIHELHPQGVLCNELEVSFPILTLRPSHVRNLKIVADKAGVGMAGIIASPLAEAMVVLSEDERMLGSCYVNIGAGCTSVSIFKNGLLVQQQVIPMGGANVTRDLTSLRLVEGDAELLKVQKASMQVDGIKDKKIKVSNGDRATEREIPLLQINRLANSRMREITLNIINIIRLSSMQDSLDGGMVISGGGAALTGYFEMLYDQLVEVREAKIRRNILESNTEDELPVKLITAVGLLNEAVVNCLDAKHPFGQMWTQDPGTPATMPTELFTEDDSPEGSVKQIGRNTQQFTNPNTNTVFIDENPEEDDDEENHPASLRRKRQVDQRKKKGKNGGSFFGKAIDKISTFLFTEED